MYERPRSRLTTPQIIVLAELAALAVCSVLGSIAVAASLYRTTPSPIACNCSDIGTSVVRTASALNTQAAAVSAPTSAAPPSAPATPALPAAPTTQPAVTEEASAGPTAAAGAYAPVINPADFGAAIDNPYMPLIPGTMLVYDGEKEDGSEHIEVYISSETKVILGVTCVVVRDTVTIDGELVEQTFDWYAQDKQGNVWYFGEASNDYEGGEVVSTAGSWEAGVDGALPGIVMHASPKVGETYRQEYYEGEAEDWASVLSVSESVSVPVGSYRDVVMTNEWSGLDSPPVYEHKYYAKGVGHIMTKYVDGGFEVTLTEVRHE